jgi:hydrogenase maturation protease
VRSDGEPGRVHWTTVGDGPIPSAPRRDSSHALGLADAVELGRALGRLPERLVLAGIEGRRFDAGVGLSPEVEASVPRVVRTILDEIERRP